jgi:hypothetical protein
MCSFLLSFNSRGLIKKEGDINMMELVATTDLSSAWNVSPRGRKALDRAVQLRTHQQAFYSAIPIVCKAEECPYAETCQLLDEDLVTVGDKCPLEIAAVEQLFQAYVDELHVDNIIDLSLVKELVDLDIGILRCENKLAIDADIIQEINFAITQRGQLITQPAIHKAAEYKDKLLNRRHSILQLLHSTRKDKEGSKLTINYDPSSRAAELLERAEAYKKAKAIDIEGGSE